MRTIERRRGTMGMLVGLLAAMLLLVACGGAEEGQTTAPAAEVEAEVEETGAAETSTSQAADTAEVEIQGTTPEEIYAELADLDPQVREQVILEGAREEGEVMFYLAQPVEFAEAWQERFREQYPDIDMQFVRAGHGDLRERFPAEERSDNSTADVLQPGGVNTPYFRDLDLLADHHRAMVPESFPDDAVGDWWINVANGPLVMTWNTTMVSEEEAPQAYEDLLDPQWRGRVAIDANPEQWVTAMLYHWGEEETEEYLRALVIDNEAVIRSGHTNILQLLAAGEFPVALEMFVQHAEGLIEEGAPLDWTTAGAVPVSSTEISISKNAPHPYAAALLVDFLLSPEGYAVWHEEGRPVTLPDADYRFPRVAELADSGEMIVIPPPEQIALGERAQELIQEIITPRFTE